MTSPTPNEPRAEIYGVCVICGAPRTLRSESLLRSNGAIVHHGRLVCSAQPGGHSQDWPLRDDRGEA